jgi:hypothetical protein
MDETQALRRVIEYESPTGQRITLTPAQVRRLDAARVWPRDGLGAEYCRVFRGLHRGVPTYDDAEIEEIIHAGGYQQVAH